MRPKALLRGLILCIATVMIGGGASAEVLRLVCRVQETKGTAQRVMGRRLEIDLASKAVRIWDNVGQGWTFKNQYLFVSADRDRILLRSGGGKLSYVDRMSGQYVFRNQTDGVIMRGPCHREQTPTPVPAPRQRF